MRRRQPAVCLRFRCSPQSQGSFGRSRQRWRPETVLAPSFGDPAKPGRLSVVDQRLHEPDPNVLNGHALPPNGHRNARTSPIHAGTEATDSPDSLMVEVTLSSLGSAPSIEPDFAPELDSVEDPLTGDHLLPEPEPVVELSAALGDAEVEVVIGELGTVANGRMPLNGSLAPPSLGLLPPW